MIDFFMLSQVLAKLQKELLAVNCFVKVSFVDTETPVVVELIESAPVLERILNQKLGE